MPRSELDGVVYLRTPWLEVTAPGGLHVNLDGEPIDGTAFRFEAMPRLLPMFLPPTAPLVGGAG